MKLIKKSNLKHLKIKYIRGVEDYLKDLIFEVIEEEDNQIEYEVVVHFMGWHDSNGHEILHTTWETTALSQFFDVWLPIMRNQSSMTKVNSIAFKLCYPENQYRNAEEVTVFSYHYNCGKKQYDHSFKGKA